MTRHHAHASNSLVMGLGVLAIVAFGAICWSGLVRLLGGAS